MRDRRIRAAFVGLILTFPMLMTLTSGRASDLSMAKTVLGVEATLAVGLLLAAKARRDLLASPDPAPDPDGPTRMIGLHVPRPRVMRESGARPIPVGVRRRPG